MDDESATSGPRQRGIVMGAMTIMVVCLTLATAMGGCVFGLSSALVRNGRIEIKAVYAMGRRDNSSRSSLRWRTWEALPPPWKRHY